ncbi:MAG: glycosyltransferase family 4 protein [Chloroflexi bacterium]|nr:glycosyltransferase family 4 protein [Chloroflexota bacterium]
MRVLFARNLFFPEDLGGNRYPYEVCRRLASRGHQVTALVPRLRVSGRLPPPGVCLRTYPVSRRHPLLTHATNVLGARLAARALSAADYDAALVGSYDVALALGATPHLRQLPLVFTYHSEFFSVWARGLRDGRGGWRAVAGGAVAHYMRWVERNVLERADRVVAVSRYSQEQIVAAAPSVDARVRLIPTGVDTTFFCPASDRHTARVALGVPDTTPVLVAVGRLTPVKRFHALVQAVALLRERGVHCRLWLVGDGPLRHDLEAQARRAGLDDRVRFWGYGDEAQVRRLAQAADLQVCSSEFEHHSLAILEALACGTPVVGTPYGGTPEILQPIDPRLVLPGGAPEQIAERVEHLLQQPGELQALRAACRRAAVERYDWDQVVARLEVVLGEAATRGVLSPES